MRSTSVLVVILGLAASSVPAQPGMLRIDQVGDYARANHDPILAPPTAFTVECWFNYDPSLPSSNAAHMVRKETSPNVSYFLRVNAPDDLEAEYVVNGSLKNLRAFSVVQPLTWHHAALTFDGSVGRLYLDFQLVDSEVTPGAPATNPGVLTMGAGEFATNERFGGDIDEVRLWGRALTSAELQANAFSTPNQGVDLRAAWHFDNGSFVDGVSGILATPSATTTLLPSTSPALGNYLEAPTIAPIGGPLQYTLNISLPGTPYLFDVSDSGASPGIPIPGVGTLPLNPPLLNYHYAAALPPGLIQGFVGVSSATGPVYPVINLPPLPWLIGQQLHASFVLIDGSAPFGIGEIGNGVVTTVTGAGPAVSGITPSTSPQAGGAAVTITGSGFQNGAQVTIGGVSATSILVMDPQTITCLTPPGPLGPADVTVTNPDTQSGTLAGGLTYVLDLVVTGVAPLGAAPGTLVTVTGAGFQSGLTLDIAGSSVPPVLVSPTSVTYTTPAGVPCGAQLTVTNPDSQTASSVSIPTRSSRRWYRPAARQPEVTRSSCWAVSSSPAPR